MSQEMSQEMRTVVLMVETASLTEVVVTVVTANAFFPELTVQNKSFWYSLSSLVLPIPYYYR
jgi:hypothetical protein